MEQLEFGNFFNSTEILKSLKEKESQGVNVDHEGVRLGMSTRPILKDYRSFKDILNHPLYDTLNPIVKSVIKAEKVVNKADSAKLVLKEEFSTVDVAILNIALDQLNSSGAQINGKGLSNMHCTKEGMFADISNTPTGIMISNSFMGVVAMVRSENLTRFCIKSLAFSKYKAELYLHFRADFEDFIRCLRTKNFQLESGEGPVIKAEGKVFDLSNSNMILRNGDVYQQFRDATSISLLDIISLKLGYLPTESGRFYNSELLVQGLKNNSLKSIGQAFNEVTYKSLSSEFSFLANTIYYGILPKDEDKERYSLGENMSFESQANINLSFETSPSLLKNYSSAISKMKFGYGGVDFNLIRLKIFDISLKLNRKVEQVLSMIFMIVTSVGTRTENKRYTTGAGNFLKFMKAQGLTDGKKGLGATDLTLGRICVAFKEERAFFEEQRTEKSLLGVQGMMKAYCYTEGTGYSSELYNKAWHIALKVIVSNWVDLNTFISKLSPANKNTLMNSDEKSFPEKLNKIRTELCLISCRRNEIKRHPDYDEFRNWAEEEDFTYFLRWKQGVKKVSSLDHFDWEDFKSKGSSNLAEKDVEMIFQSIFKDSDTEFSKSFKTDRKSKKSGTGKEGFVSKNEEKDEEII